MGTSLGHVESLNDEFFEPSTINPSNKLKMRQFMCAHYLKDQTENLDELISTLTQYLTERNYSVKNMTVGEPQHENDILCIVTYLDGTTYNTTIKQVHLDNYLNEAKS